LRATARLSLDIARFWGASAIGSNTDRDVTRPSDEFRCSRLAEYPTINAERDRRNPQQVGEVEAMLGAGLSGTSTKAAGRAIGWGIDCGLRKEGRDLLKVIAPFLKPMPTSTTLGSVGQHHVNVQPGHLVVQELFERAFVYVRHASENPDLLDP
jgi:hypothetical protein